MGVFDGDIQIPLAVPDPRTDYMLPAPGALSYSSITEDTALAGTNGHDALLLSGNRDRQMNGNESTRITENRSHEVGGDQKKQIAGNKNENVVGNFLHQTIGNMHRSIVGATNDLFTGVHAIQHKADQKLHEPVDFLHYIQSSTATYDYFSGTYKGYACFADQYLNVIGINADFKLTQVGVTVGEAQKAIFSTADKDVKLKASITETSFREAHVMIGAVQPGVYAAMLHEVAFTQKIITIGVNQFM